MRPASSRSTKHSKARPQANAFSGRFPRRFELLEHRRLLTANVAETLQLVNSAGNPVSSVTVGQDFTLNVYVQDIETKPVGIQQAYFNVTYSSSLASVNGALTHGLEYEQREDGTTSTAGSILDAGGYVTNGAQPSQPGGSYLLFSVPLVATAAGTLKFSSTLTAVQTEQVLLWDQLSFQTSSEVSTGERLAHHPQRPLAALGADPDRGRRYRHLGER